MVDMEAENQKRFNWASGAFIPFAKKFVRWQVDSGDYTGTRRKLSLVKYTREDIVKFLRSPELYCKQLREASRYLYEVSMQYYRLISYFSKLITLDYVIVPYKFNKSKVTPERFRSAYQKASDYIQTMNLKHELLQVLTVAYREDVFYGYTLVDKDAFHIMALDPDFCKITSIVDGTYIFSFDFNYFNQHPDELDTYPTEFRQKFEAFRRQEASRWQELDWKKQFCIKVREDIFPSPVIPFSGVLEYIYRILDYADLQQTREELENYKVIALKMKTNADGSLAISKELAQDFYNQLCNVLPASVGAFMTPCDVQDISFDRSNAADSDLTTNATVDFWNAAGVSAMLFGGDKQTSASLSISVKADIAMAMGVIQQVERVVNRLLKDNLQGSIKFQINFLPVSIFTQKEMNELYLKNAQYGLPTKMMAAAVTGQTPDEIVGMTYLENVGLELKGAWVPLNSSHTETVGGSSNPEASDSGKVLIDESNMTDATERARQYE